MSLSIITDDNLKSENAVENEILSCIDRSESFVFNAGAGSGKTYALVRSLKHIIKIQGQKLSIHNQKALCITYTNVASNEVKERLGNTNIIEVSTIHERLWGMVGRHQKELVRIHVEKLEADLETLNNILLVSDDEKDEKVFREYRALEERLQQEFLVYMLSMKEVFYNAYDRPSTEFKKVFGDSLSTFPKIINNVANFKKIVSTIFKIENYKSCLLKISEKEIGFQSIKYDSRFNSDLLHKMIISHDTLIEYSFLIIKRFDLLKKILIDNYPYFFVDEYQDTHPQVVSMLSCLNEYAIANKLPFMVGYFGDKAQNIYDEGVGHSIGDLHRNLKIVYKNFNRRSHSKIIDVINLIRDDEVKQKSIFEDCNDGTVKFYFSKHPSDTEVVNAFVNKYREQWKITSDNKLHCLVLTNKLVAELNGFNDIYLFFSSTGYYKKYYDRLNTELLSTETSKLGIIPSLIFRVLNFRCLLNSSKSSVSTLLGPEIYSRASLLQIKDLIFKLKSITGNNLYEYFISCFEIYSSCSPSDLYFDVIHSLFGLEECSFERVLSVFGENLFPNVETSDEITGYQIAIENFLKINISQFDTWYGFVGSKQTSDVVYHTYHGTKGLEFDNVIIIMENDFGVMNRGVFPTFFDSHSTKGALLDQKDKQKFLNIKNLMYVSCSRARKNLRVLYLDDVASFDQGVTLIFSEVNSFNFP